MQSKSIKLTFPFSRLSTELALEIIRFAAAPDLSSSNAVRRPDNPYAIALSLCLVSRAFRHAVIPELLHTVLLSRSCHVSSFVNALRMQKVHHLNARHLHVDYTRHVRRIWVDECCAPLVPSLHSHENMPYGSMFHDEQTDSTDTLDYTLLAPALLAAPELAINFSGIHILYYALESVWFAPSHKPSSLPWRTKSLTLTGDFWRWRPLTGTAEGTAFLASLSRIVLLIPSIVDMPTSFLPNELLKMSSSEVCRIPHWISSVPWHAFAHLEQVVIPLERCASVSEYEMKHGHVDVNLLVLTLPLSCEAGWVQLVLQNPSVGDAYSRVERISVALHATKNGCDCGRLFCQECSSSRVDEQSSAGILQLELHYDWEEVWARTWGLVG
ncbi:hypothetical protein SERLA73DRAFT_190652 [Serpula lacrymans var. lacrymans S7.3]|uniref:Uncharacterized protein n=2 Tax=Serpula lacrymans var. lacrymans TaxID=341189 RepID=F8QG44_SERL3|nr:uncharacterized protein SERLADRAFT_463529 [Serpula lacrymans var. lacrymans S7.9]EGN92792.1 hypothetical protein SERLA73DRAFT_190652 [Serpula lacrymans var. lacrymans S7.3]EGO26450.1 hypothetical protein SERLADRAFT_463529 [Serpula lacrymans var. lacrymans S7.9]